VTLVSTVRRIVIRQSDVFFSEYLALNIKTPRAFETSGTTTLRKRLNATKVELSENNLFPLNIPLFYEYSLGASVKSRKTAACFVLSVHVEKTWLQLVCFLRTSHCVIELKDNNKCFIFFNEIQQILLFNLLTTSSSHWTIIRPSLHKI